MKYLFVFLFGVLISAFSAFVVAQDAEPKEELFPSVLQLRPVVHLDPSLHELRLIRRELQLLNQKL